ncbi:MAG: class I SAM-dependent methyltransferase [Sphingobacteriia bacterium]|jgi:hypothetical protein
MHKNHDYIPGDFETQKHAHKKEAYYKGMATIKDLNYSFEDLIHYFPCFTGAQTLTRFLSFYECYKSTLGLAGHIAEVGIYKGASMLFFSKLTQIFEPNSFTQVHGFDWFQGNNPSEEESSIIKNSDIESYERLMKLVKAQGLDNIAKVHKLDVTTELDAFFTKHSHLQFKMVFLDAGMYEVVKSCLPYFWNRLNKGGYLILDQFNFDIAPGETRAIKEFLGEDVQIKTFPWGWMPTAYIVK